MNKSSIGHSDLLFRGGVLLLISLSTSVVESKPSGQQEVDFRYVIAMNRIQDKDTPEFANRYLIILMDEKAFTEENLEKLSRHILKKYPKPHELMADICTNIEQVPTPEEMRMPKMSAGRGRANLYKYNRALLKRFEDNEYFRYTPQPGANRMKSVVIKGIDRNFPTK